MTFTPPRKIQKHCILCNTDSVFVATEKISCYHVKVISHPIISPMKKKVIATSELILRQLIWQTQTDFGEDSPDYGEDLEVRIMPTPFPFPFAQTGENNHKDARLT